MKSSTVFIISLVVFILFAGNAPAQQHSTRETALYIWYDAGTGKGSECVHVYLGFICWRACQNQQNCTGWNGKRTSNGGCEIDYLDTSGLCFPLKLRWQTDIPFQGGKINAYVIDPNNYTLEIEGSMVDRHFDNFHAPTPNTLHFTSMRIGDASWTRNCHGYAFDLGNFGNYWIEYPGQSTVISWDWQPFSLMPTLVGPIIKPIAGPGSNHTLRIELSLPYNNYQVVVQTSEKDGYGGIYRKWYTVQVYFGAGTVYVPR